MHENRRESAHNRIGDTARHQAMDRLGTFFADGYLDVDEFNARTEAAASARTQAELRALFADLPGDDNNLAAAGSSVPAVAPVGTAYSPHASASQPSAELCDPDDRELQNLLNKGKKLKIVDGLATTVGILTIVLLVTGLVSYA